jgi:voltage-gated potassium channel
MFAILAFSVLGNALTFFFFESSAEPAPTIYDSFWYSIISITTIGYGDWSASTLGARIGTVVFVVIVGLVAFTATAGMLVDWIFDLRMREQTGMATVQSKGHLLIIHFPNETRVRHLVDEFVSDATHNKDDIVVVTDTLQTLPFSHPNVSFVRGSPLEEETYQRAQLSRADKAIILSTNYNDPNSDSVVASVASVIHHLSPQVRVVAECMSLSHKLLFSNVEDVSVVYTVHMANNLLIQETQDPGVTILTQAMTSNLIEGTLASTKVESPVPDSLSYEQVAVRLIMQDINLVGVIRYGRAYLKFGDLFLSAGDLLVYISSRRFSWPGLHQTLSN